MNYLANKSLSRGFSVISDKRVYFRGSCFSGQGKNLHRTDEERTVDVKDVTGSGFIYRRYIGILLGLFAVIFSLLIAVGGCISSGRKLFYEFENLQRQEWDVEEKIAQIGAAINKKSSWKRI